MKKLLLLLCLIPQILFSQLVINEVAPNNRYFDDEDNTYSDWIEIMNIGVYNINVAQFGIPIIWTPGINGCYLILQFTRRATDHFMHQKNRDCYGCPGVINYLHTNFKRSNGETVALFDEAGLLIDSITIGSLYAGHTMARIPDGGAWCYSNEPTPDNANDVTCYSGYSTEPAFNTAPGFYAGSVDVSVTGTNVYYTTDGDWPEASGIAYTSPITVGISKVVKIATIEPGKLPSRTVTGSFFINETTLLPVVSISSNSCDMFDEGPSCIAAYDGADGWEPDNPQIPASVEYFTADHQQQFNKNIKFETGRKFINIRISTARNAIYY
ncbi:MAG: chitobiase/beta-hexosaminidase C-terminal domain-containing protein [Bacteroidetes bacterium]|nr:chitobiase/beta-hexosaminidase C-terminal domain-containing protein [Bacteroidota bacterium]